MRETGVFETDEVCIGKYCCICGTVAVSELCESVCTYFDATGEYIDCHLGFCRADADCHAGCDHECDKNKCDDSFGGVAHIFSPFVMVFVL